MKIKRILIFAIPVVLAGVGFLVYRMIKKKKEAAEGGGAAEAEVKTVTKTTTVPSAISPAIKTTVTKTEPVATVSAGVAKPTAKISRVLECGSTHKAIAQVGKTTSFKINDYVNVDTPLYKGKYKIWYVYNKAADVTNLYLDTPFKGSTTGTLTKA